MMWIACGGNSTYSFIPNFFKLVMCFYHGLKLCISHGYNPHVNFCQYFCFFHSIIFFSASLLSEYTTYMRNFYSFPLIIMKFCRLVLHALCLCFWGYPPFIFYQLFFIFFFIPLLLSPRLLEEAIKMFEIHIPLLTKP